MELSIFFNDNNAGNRDEDSPPARSASTISAACALRSQAVARKVGDEGGGPELVGVSA